MTYLLSLVIVALLFVAYAMFGPYLPPPWTHRGYDVSRLVGHLFIDPGDQVLSSDLMWENYNLTWETRLSARISTYPFFDQKLSGFNITAFTQALAADGRTGWGLGLSICRSIVQTHEGSIVVESAPGQGSLFRVLIPLVLPSKGGSG